MTPSLLLWNDKSERTVVSSKNSDATPLQFALKCEPIVDLSTACRYGFEVLTHLPAHINSEEYFTQLSLQRRQNLFFQQVTNVRHFRQDQHYSLNLPMKALADWPFFHAQITSYPPGLIIEIQDPETFLSLSACQRTTVLDAIQRVETCGIPIWLDDVNEDLMAAFIAAKWHLSGIKLDKNIFWAVSKIPGKLHQLIQMGKKIADLVIIEGIETEKHKKIALQAGANLGQGYLWPAIYPDKA